MEFNSLPTPNTVIYNVKVCGSVVFLGVGLDTGRITARVVSK